VQKEREKKLGACVREREKERVEEREKEKRSGNERLGERER